MAEVTTTETPCEEAAWGYMISGVGGREILAQDATREDLFAAIVSLTDHLESISQVSIMLDQAVTGWRNGKKAVDFEA